MEIRLIATAFIVTFLRLTCGEPSSQAGHNKVQNNLHDLFDSINKNEVKRTQDFRNILEREAAVEQHAFDAAKEDFRLARQRNTHKPKDVEQKRAYKRQVPFNERAFAADQFPPKYWFGRWETTPLKDDLTRYIQTKEKFHLTYPKNEETFREKTRACMGIVSSEYMEVNHHVEALDIHEQADFEEIKSNYTKIFNRSFKKWSPFQNQVELENPYRLRDVSIGNETAVHPREYDRNAVYGLPEYVFSCLARHRDTKKYVEYFISQEYPIPTSEAYGPTRFIFEYADETATRIKPIGESRLPTSQVFNPIPTPKTCQDE